MPCQNVEPISPVVPSRTLLRALGTLWMLIVASAVPAGSPPPPPAHPPAPAVNPPPPTLTALAALGQKIFNDPNLSNPKGTACVSCHQPSSGYADGHGSVLGVAAGSTPGALGLRNPLQAAYSAAIPPFGFATAPDGTRHASGGQFWDGRADTLAQQALLPLLNSAEMNNPSAAAVVTEVASAPYASQFEQVFGPGALSNSPQAFTRIGLAIQAWEQASAFQPFSSKYDAVLAGKASFTPAEARGLALFTDPVRANCASCHAMNPASRNPADSLFTSFGYHATGVPRNAAIPQNASAGFYDLGLCGPQRTTPVPPAGVDPASLCGKFRTPSLRNVALRPRYMHNGVFTDLNEVVSFYATRASDPQRWYGPSGVPNDLPARYLKNLETHAPPFDGSPATGAVLSAAQISDLVSFLGTLSDGYPAK